MEIRLCVCSTVTNLNRNVTVHPVGSLSTAAHRKGATAYMLRRNAPAYTMPLCDSAEPLHSVFWPNVAPPGKATPKRAREAG